MKKTSDIVAMIIDTSGNYISLAVRLAKEYKQVYYCIPSWVDSYPGPNKSNIGQGIDEITVVENPFDVYDEIDFWIFPDTYYGAFQEFLKAQGEITWGSGAAEDFELKRDMLKEEMKKLGLPTGKYAVVLGVTALREYLQNNKGKWVKVNKWRGLIETFYSESYDLVKPELDDIEYTRGIDAELIEFVCEDPIPGKEMGYDGYSVDGQYPAEWVSGAECKDHAYIGQWKKYVDLPKALTEFNTKFAPVFKDYGYRGFFSLENRISDKDGKSYMSDFTARCPCPPGSIYQLIQNLGEVMWAGANGEMVLAKPGFQFAVELLIESEWACRHTCSIYFPKEAEPFIKLKKYRIKDGVYQIVPIPSCGSSDIGSIVAGGKTLEEAKKKVLAIAEQIKGTEIKIDVHALDDAEKVLEEVGGMK